MARLIMHLVAYVAVPAAVNIMYRRPEHADSRWPLQAVEDPSDAAALMSDGWEAELGLAVVPNSARPSGSTVWR